MSSTTLRQRKKDETRLMISNVATRLFVARGFDEVTVAEIAEAAGVAKMTVFNYFARKEELFFDRNEEGRRLFEEALAGKKHGESPLDALHGLVKELVAGRHPITRFSAAVSRFWRTVDASAALCAYVRELREEAEVALAEALARSVGARAHDPIAGLLAVLLIGTWAAAYREALRRQRAGEAAARVMQSFVDVLERGFAAAASAAEGTPYARKSSRSLSRSPQALNAEERSDTRQE